MTIKAVQMAFDRSMRRIDQDGRLQVEQSAISKATVNPYYGREIPDADALGLEPDRVYMLLRDPAELERAAPTFNNIPLLSKHVPVTADKPEKEHVVGSTGTDAFFDGVYLLNSLVVWDSVAIAGINTKEQCELSSAYRYRADMTPGEFNGVRYDGVMRDIRGNHVALVEVGRAGPDVYVFDSQPTEQTSMKRSRLAVALGAALAATLVPMLAQDAALGNLGPVVGKVKKETLDDDIKRIAAETVKATSGKLAADSALDADKLARILKLAADAADDDEDKDKPAEDDEEDKDKPAEDDEEDKDKPAEDDEEDDKEKSVAQDAATIRRDAEAAAVKRMQAIRVAEKEVAPFVGEVAAMDSAAAVYKVALDAAGVDLAGVPKSAYRAMVRMLRAPSERRAVSPIAQDSASVADFNKMFPNAKRPGRI